MQEILSLKNKTFLSFLQKLARECGKIIKKYFQQNFKIELKSDLTPVTIADRLAEEKLRLLIEKEFPKHGIIGEEFGEKNSTNDYVWLLDPIDGTKSFVCGVPLFGTLIGLLKKDKPLVGVIANPILDIFLCGDNQLATLNGQKVKTSSCKTLANAVLSTTSFCSSLQKSPNFLKLVNSVRLSRGWGDCFGYYLLACGKIDIMLDPILNKWDSLPLVPILKGAGVVFTNWEGSDLVSKPTSLIAANKYLHKKVLRLIHS